MTEAAESPIDQLYSQGKLTMPRREKKNSTRKQNFKSKRARSLSIKLHQKTYPKKSYETNPLKHGSRAFKKLHIFL
jgi:hypothetical protein